MLSHAFGAAFDNPDLIVAAVVGDGEAETGPLAGSWKGVDVPQPGARRRGAADPAPQRLQDRGPTVLGRASDDDVRACSRATATRSISSRATTRRGCTRRSPRRSTPATTRIRAIQQDGAHHGVAARPRWPAIVLRTPKGWTGPKVVDGMPVEGTFRAHQVPIDRRADEPRAPRGCSRPGCAATGPEELFDADGRLIPELAALAPQGDRRMGANPHANGGKRAGGPRHARLPRLRASPSRSPATERARVDPPARQDDARHLHGATRTQANFRLFCPDETNSNRLGNVFEVENRCFVGPDARHRRPRGAGRPRDGGAQRAPLRGLAGGLPADRPARPVRDLRGVRDGLGVDDGAAHQVAGGGTQPPLARAGRRRSTSC